MRITRRTLFAGAGAGALAIFLASCTPDEPDPTPVVPTPTAEPVPDPTPVGEIPEAAAMFRTAWANDPYAFGARSVTPAGTTATARAALAAPLLQRVFIAGEATSPDKPGTVAGAAEEGRRAAEAIAELAEEGERIAVVGAGMAGATAAGVLTAAGYDVTVIEARDRTGGRLATEEDDSWPVPPQHGAWLFPAADTAAPQLALVGIGSVEVTERVGIREEEGEPPATKKIAAALEDARAAAADATISEALEALDHDGEFVAALSALSAFSGVDPETASAWYAPALGDDEMTALVSDVAPAIEKALGDAEVTLSTAVSGVSYDDEGVSLRFASGESMTYDRVVLTVPLGVLRAEAIEFEPALPFEHRGAVAELDMGQMESVWLRYEAPFWQTTAGIWQVVGPEPDEAAEDDTAEAVEGELPAVQPMIRTWINLLPATGQPILVGLVGGADARAFAELDDDAVNALAVTSLAPFASPSE